MVTQTVGLVQLRRLQGGTSDQLAGTEETATALASPKQY